MYPENPEETQVIVGSMNMGYISDTARNWTHNLFRPRREPIPLGHSAGLTWLDLTAWQVDKFEIIIALRRAHKCGYPEVWQNLITFIYCFIFCIYRHGWHAAQSMYALRVHRSHGLTGNVLRNVGRFYHTGHNNVQNHRRGGDTMINGQ